MWKNVIAKIREGRHRVKNAVRILRGQGIVPDVDRELVWYTDPQLTLVSTAVPKSPPGTRLVRMEECWAVLGQSGEILSSGSEIAQVVQEAWDIFNEFRII